MKKLLKIKELASYLGVSVATIYRLTKHDPLFPKGILLTAKCHLWNIDEIEAWLESISGSNSRFKGLTHGED